MKVPKSILVTGASGQLGMEFRTLAGSYPGFRFIFVGKEELPIENEKALNAFFELTDFFACINCAAYTAVDKAETEKDAAMRINGEAVGKLAAYCYLNGTHFIHLSTDYVFNGESERPYKEDDPTDPVNFYGNTKLMGEQAALQNNPESLIIRTSWVYSEYGNNFVKTMLRLMDERESLGVVADQFGCPTYAADLAAAVLTILEEKQWVPGIYHYCNEGIISWYDLAKAIKDESGWSGELRAITTADFPTAAKRPGYSALDHQKIKNTYGVEIMNWRDSLQKCIRRLSGL